MNIIFAGLGIMIGIGIFILYIWALDNLGNTPAVVLICSCTYALSITGLIYNPEVLMFLTILGMSGIILILHVTVLIRRRVTIVDCTTPFVANPYKAPDTSVNRTV